MRCRTRLRPARTQEGRVILRAEQVGVLRVTSGVAFGESAFRGRDGAGDGVDVRGGEGGGGVGGGDGGDEGEEEGEGDEEVGEMHSGGG